MRWSVGVLAWLALATVGAAAAEPWEFPDEVARAAAADEGLAWGEAYEEAVDQLESRPDADPERAIRLLRWSIAERADDPGLWRGLKRLRRRIGGDVYAPYYYLGLAFARQGRLEAAAATLARENVERLGKEPELNERYQRLRGDVQARRAAREPIAAARRAAGWSRGEGSLVTLSPETSGQAGTALAAAERLEGLAVGSGEVAKQAPALVERIETALMALYEQETAARRALLERLAAPEFAPYVGDAPLSPAACATRAKDDSAAALSDLQGCATAASGALREAVERACAAAARAAERAEGQERRATGWGAGVSDVSAASLPEPCRRDGGSLLEALVREDASTLGQLPEAVDRLERRADELAKAARAARERMLPRVSRALEEVEVPPAGCVDALELGARVGRLRRDLALLEQVRQSGEPAAGLAAALRRTEQAADLDEQLVERARELAEGASGSVPEADLEALRAALAERTTGEASIEALCAAAARVSAADTEQAARLERRIERARRLLELVPPEESAASAGGCAPAALAALEQAASRAPGEEGPGVRETLGVAESCLERIEQAAAALPERLAAARTRVAAAPQVARRLAARFPPQAVARFGLGPEAAGRLSDQAEQLARRLEALEQAVQGAGEDEAAVRARLEQADLLDRLDDRQSAALDRLDADEPGRGAGAARLLTALPVLAASEAELARFDQAWAAHLEAARAALLIRELFETATDEGLDAAIAQMRRAERERRWPESAGPRAALEAAAARLLSLRARAAESPALRAALDREAAERRGRRQALAPALSLPDVLFGGDGSGVGGEARPD
jgi:hypothetical protein